MQKIKLVNLTYICKLGQGQSADREVLEVELPRRGSHLVPVSFAVDIV